MRKVVLARKEEKIVAYYDDGLNFGDEGMNEANRRWFHSLYAAKAKEAIEEWLHEVGKSKKDRTWWWRCTSNKEEDKVVGEISSFNHASGFYEEGLSVSEHEFYQSFCGFRYIYPVTGEFVGTGSDGEPLLKNVKPLGRPQASPHKKYVKLNEQLDKRPSGLREQKEIAAIEYLVVGLDVAEIPLEVEVIVEL